MRLIDVDELRKEHCKGCNLDMQQECLSDPLCASMMWLHDAPTVDAVEVVRCKDCRHTDTDGCGAIYCEKWDRWEMPEDFFCSYGERKEK